jgi:hypothetical protein
VLEFGTTLFEVDPQQGARITRFSLNGQNVIAGADVTGMSINWGSTFWPSPQSVWSWPPITSIDSEAYTAALEGNTIVLTSPPPASTGPRVSVVKRFSANLSAGAIELQFTLKNEEATAKSWAPWQVTRVAPNGLTFFATGVAPVYNKLTVTNSGGITWFKQPEGIPTPLPTSPDQPKLIADAGEPWLAYATGKVVFIKTFPAVTPAEFAPAEGEVEIYAVPAYEEIEPQGAYVLMQPGATQSWTVRWYLRDVPAGATVSAGDAALVSFVRSVAQP